ncbi:Aspartyl/glutamyl-tRNA (Asn/Gln) amidotransferase subunit B [Gossypium arboreum]|uniref:Aspartyl/glutamyl-tRNA (Asn/Gln) amidotransferase subunit B n=2 Tax=Gossypium arboreum TaxID=29729 RepID=A0A0B0MPR8_GOSAR|nr:Aspartyl/glutamyl-tRNA (Asn/Gln) amidotransferase subunit B [Gossypium arboreum]
MKLCLNELNLNMFRSRTKEIRFGSGENKSCRLAARSIFHRLRFWIQVTSSGIVSKVYHTIDRLRYFISCILELWHV